MSDHPNDRAHEFFKSLHREGFRIINRGKVGEDHIDLALHDEHTVALMLERISAHLRNLAQEADSIAAKMREL